MRQSDLRQDLRSMAARIQMLEGDAALVVLGLLGEGRASASHASAGC